MKKIILFTLLSFQSLAIAIPLPIEENDGPVVYECRNAEGVVLYTGLTFLSQINTQLQRCYANGGQWVFHYALP